MKSSQNDRLYQKVAADLATRISAGEFSGADRLPTERKLADMLSVSRTTVREALLALELRGILKIRSGSGIYIVEQPQSGAFLNQVLEISGTPQETLEVRMMLEIELAGRAAERASPEQINDIQAAIEWGWQDFRSGRFRHDDLNNDPDGLFHFSVARAAQNNTSAILVKQLWGSMRSPLTESVESLVQIEQYAELSILDHERILQKIKNKDAPAARDAMKRHLTRYQKIIGWTEAR